MRGMEAPAPPPTLSGLLHQEVGGAWDGHGAGVCIPAPTTCCDLGDVTVVRASKDKTQRHVLPTALGWVGPFSHQAVQFPAMGPRVQLTLHWHC